MAALTGSFSGPCPPCERKQALWLLSCGGWVWPLPRPEWLPRAVTGRAIRAHEEPAEHSGYADTRVESGPCVPTVAHFHV